MAILVEPTSHDIVVIKSKQDDIEIELPLVDSHSAAFAVSPQFTSDYSRNVEHIIDDELEFSISGMIGKKDRDATLNKIAVLAEEDHLITIESNISVPINDMTNLTNMMDNLMITDFSVTQTSDSRNLYEIDVSFQKMSIQKPTLQKHEIQSIDDINLTPAPDKEVATVIIEVDDDWEVEEEEGWISRLGG